MTNRTLVISTSILVASLLLLLGLNLSSILQKSSPTATYLQYDQIRGMDIKYRDSFYTLNFKQQNDIVDIFNQAVRVVGLKPNKRQKPDIEKIVIYRFGLPDLIVTPVAYVENNLVYSTPEWNEESYLMEMSDGYLRQIITQSYDH